MPSLLQVCGEYRIHNADIEMRGDHSVRTPHGPGPAPHSAACSMVYVVLPVDTSPTAPPVWTADLGTATWQRRTSSVARSASMGCMHGCLAPSLAGEAAARGGTCVCCVSATAGRVTAGG